MSEGGRGTFWEVLLGRARQLGRRRAGTERGRGHLSTPFRWLLAPAGWMSADKFIPVCRPPQHPSPRPQKKAPPGHTPQRAPPGARAAPAWTASTAPRSLGAAFENGSGQGPRGAGWWLCRRTFRLMTCTDRMSVAQRWDGVHFVSVGPVAGRETRGLYVEGPQTAPNFGKKKFFT